MHGISVIEEDRSLLAGIKQRSVFILSPQLNIRPAARNKIMAGDALFLPVEVYCIHYRMTGPTAECMPHRRTVTACHGSNCNETYPAASETFWNISRKSAVIISASIKESPNTAIRTSLSSASESEEEGEDERRSRAS